jgi:hypothetical protein
MLVVTLLAFCSIIVIGAIFFIECKIIEDLPEDNTTKKWWRKHIIAPNPEG